MRFFAKIWRPLLPFDIRFEQPSLFSISTGERERATFNFPMKTTGIQKHLGIRPVVKEQGRVDVECLGSFPLLAQNIRFANCS